MLVCSVNSSRGGCGFKKAKLSSDSVCPYFVRVEEEKQEDQESCCSKRCVYSVLLSVSTALHLMDVQGKSLLCTETYCCTEGLFLLYLLHADDSEMQSIR